jgi:hypothetical protein
MQYILGLATMLVFFICLGLAFYYGYKLGGKQKPAEAKLTEQEKEQEKIKRRMEGLQNMMNYDINQALGVKRE